jgi:hypothetical protein
MSVIYLRIGSAAAVASGRVWAKALAFLNAGDCLVVWKLDRSGRLLPHLLTTVTDLRKRGIAFRSLTEQIDTTTPQGEFLFHAFGALAQFDRSLIQERVQAGLAAARLRGRRGGRPAAVDAEKLAAVITALDAGASRQLDGALSRDLDQRIHDFRRFLYPVCAKRYSSPVQARNTSVCFCWCDAHAYRSMSLTAGRESSQLWQRTGLEWLIHSVKETRS